jgi:hypothetical protein
MPNPREGGGKQAAIPENVVLSAAIPENVALPVFGLRMQGSKASGAGVLWRSLWRPLSTCDHVLALERRAKEVICLSVGVSVCVCVRVSLGR